MGDPALVSLLFVGGTLALALGLAYGLQQLAAVRAMLAQHAAYVARGEALLAEDRRRIQEKAVRHRAEAARRRREGGGPRAAAPAAAAEDSDATAAEAEDAALVGGAEDGEDEATAFARLDPRELRSDIFVGVRVYPTLAENAAARLRRVAMLVRSTLAVVCEREVWESLLLGVRSLDRGFFAAGLCTTLASSVVGVFTVSTTGALLNVIKDAATGHADAPGRAAALLAWIFCFALAELLLSSARSYLFVRCETEGFATLARRYHRNALIQDAAFYKSQGRDLYYFVASDVDTLKGMVVNTPRTLLRHVIDLGVGACVCLWMDWGIALALLLLRLPEAAGVTAYRARVDTAYVRLMEEDKRRLTQYMRDSVTQVISVQNMAAEEAEVQAAAALSAAIKEVSTFHLYPTMVFSIIQTFSSSVESYTQTVLLARAVLQGRMSVGDYVTYTAFYAKVSSGLTGVTNFLLELRDRSLALKRFFYLRTRRNANGVQLRRHGDREAPAAAGSEGSSSSSSSAMEESTPSLLERGYAGGGGSGAPAAPAEPPTLLIIDPATGAVRRQPLQGAIEFDNVVFSYPAPEDTDRFITSTKNTRLGRAPPGARASAQGPPQRSDAAAAAAAAPVLNGFSLKIAPGQRVAIVGPSGAGKSTLLRLISGHYLPTSGRLLIDGIDAATLSVRHLRQCIGYVEQEPILMQQRSVRENICYGMRRPWPPQEEVAAVCARAAILDTIEGKWRELGGFDALIGGEGLEPSGGEKQRLVVARALMRSPRLLLLDESTSSLDPEREAAVVAALERAMAGRTTIMLAHRLCTVQNADLIVFMSALCARARAARCRCALLLLCAPFGGISQHHAHSSPTPPSSRLCGRGRARGRAGHARRARGQKGRVRQLCGPPGHQGRGGGRGGGRAAGRARRGRRRGCWGGAGCQWGRASGTAALPAAAWGIGAIGNRQEATHNPEVQNVVYFRVSYLFLVPSKMDASGGYGTGRSASPGLGASRSQGGSQVLGMTGGTSMRAQLDSLSMTVHEVVGRIELSGRQILMLCVPSRPPA